MANMQNEIVEKVAKAIEDVRIFSRYNDWTSDRVEGLPIEIVLNDPERGENVTIIARFAGRESECKQREEEIVRIWRARAAIEAVSREGRVMDDSGVLISKIIAMKTGDKAFILTNEGRWRAAIGNRSENVPIGEGIAYSKDSVDFYAEGATASEALLKLYLMMGGESPQKVSKRGRNFLTRGGS